MVRDRIPARFGLDPFRDIQVLTPMNRSELGTQSLNQRLQEVLNPRKSGAEVQRFGVTSTCRASLALYSGKDDVDALVEGIEKAQKFFA